MARSASRFPSPLLVFPARPTFARSRLRLFAFWDSAVRKCRCRGSFEKAPPIPALGQSSPCPGALKALGARSARRKRSLLGEAPSSESGKAPRGPRRRGCHSRLGPSGTVPVVRTVQIMRVRSASRRLSPRRLPTPKRQGNASPLRSRLAHLRFIARIPFPVPTDHETFRRAGDGCARGGRARGACGPYERQGPDEGFVQGLRAAPARCERGGRASARTRQGTARGAETV